MKVFVKVGLSTDGIGASGSGAGSTTVDDEQAIINELYELTQSPIVPCGQQHAQTPEPFVYINPDDDADMWLGYLQTHTPKNLFCHMVNHNELNAWIRYYVNSTRKMHFYLIFVVLDGANNNHRHHLVLHTCDDNSRNCQCPEKSLYRIPRQLWTSQRQNPNDFFIANRFIDVVHNILGRMYYDMPSIKGTAENRQFTFGHARLGNNAILMNDRFLLALAAKLPFPRYFNEWRSSRVYSAVIQSKLDKILGCLLAVDGIILVNDDNKADFIEGINYIEQIVAGAEFRSDGEVDFFKDKDENIIKTLLALLWTYYCAQKLRPIFDLNRAG